MVWALGTEAVAEMAPGSTSCGRHPPNSSRLLLPVSYPGGSSSERSWDELSAHAPPLGTGRFGPIPGHLSGRVKGTTGLSVDCAANGPSRNGNDSMLSTDADQHSSQ